ncbi:MAG TPA: hypothetical protein VLL28_16975 [Hyphomicrobiaceae bacterium]|nr:hypothetical protein [Hyphomicrobiaceae bacterium]
MLAIAKMEFPLGSKEEWDKSPPPAAFVSAQQTISWAEHLVIIHPSGSAQCRPPQGFLRAGAATGFAVALTPDGGWTKLSSGGSVRAVVGIACEPLCIGGISACMD